MSANVKNRDYATSISKHHSRKNCLVTPYRKYFNLLNLPDDKQYWTLCNLCAEDGVVKKGSEYDMIVHEEKLCKPNQFYGVEIDEEIAKENLLLNKGNWFLNEIHEEMLYALSNNNFNPGLINIDTGVMYVKAVDLLSKILLTISDSEIDNVYVCLNYVLTCHHHENGTVNDIIKILEKSPKIIEAFRLKPWIITKNQYIYNGVSEKRTQMASVGFLLKTTNKIKSKTMKKTHKADYTNVLGKTKTPESIIDQLRKTSPSSQPYMYKKLINQLNHN